MTMTSLRDRFAALDQRRIPDLWPDVERRAADLARTEPLTSVSVRGASRRTGADDRGGGLLIAATLLVAVLAGTIAVGSGLVSLPKIAPSPAPSQTAPTASEGSSTPQPSRSLEPSGPRTGGVAPWVVFQVSAGNGAAGGHDTRLWAIRADGGDSHELRAGNYMTTAWSRDGTRLLLNDGRLWLADVADAIGPFADTGIAVPQSAQWEAFDFALDGEHVVFVQRDKCPRGSAASGSDAIVLAAYVAETAGANCWVLSTIDLRTTKRTELDRTLVRDQTARENFALELPAWSPDGTRIAYVVVDEAHGTSELWVVDRDGSDPTKVDLDAAVPVSGPRWSPDGTRIAFTSQRWLSTSDSDSAIAVVELATGHVVRLTVGASSGRQQVCCADWIDDTRLRVQGASPDDGDRFWVVPSDGGPADPDPFVDLTDVLAAHDPPLRPSIRSAPGDPGRSFFWQPAGR
jgi:hypothetical protein